MLFDDVREIFNLVNTSLRNYQPDAELDMIISVENSVHEGSFQAKIIKCKLISGEIIILRLKYSDPADGYDSERPGIAYEAKVYEYVLKNTALSSVPFYGSLYKKDSDAIILGFLDNSIPIKHSSPVAFKLASEWIADFHKQFESKDIPFLKKQNSEFFNQWSGTINTLLNGSRELSWFRKLHDCYIDNIPVLLSGDKTIVHGEYYGKNILIRDNTIYPLDWEACAFGPAEVDLAALLDGKDPERIKLAIDGYTAIRYPDKLPENFYKKLILAELYFKFRWIAEWVTNSTELKLWLTNPEFNNRLRQLSVELKCN